MSLTRKTVISNVVRPTKKKKKKKKKKEATIIICPREIVINMSVVKEMEVIKIVSILLD